jgi:hypothetical protein
VRRLRLALAVRAKLGAQRSNAAIAAAWRVDRMRAIADGSAQ